ncbi:uncharacterized protein LOC121255306 [Juglans microcarpa x Juglans regia]|uniref:uncharacterized protein LOC121255306 n=1 Tax=Juglans microcarpa x Juglans regia TaxID=2249226 RepID=UPI001B7E713E|nr:uncharacterized protein LOC121255306 [Juglans microcarpa x Juglans regia]
MLEDEILAHILWSCFSAKDVWLLCSKSIQKANIQVSSFLSVFEFLIDRLSSQKLVLFATLTRLIWFRRNSLIHDGHFQSPNVLFDNAVKVVDEYCNARAKSARFGIQNLLPTTRWETPPSSWVKVNWDVAVRYDFNKIGVGVVIREADGSVLANLMQPRFYCTDLVLAKARGLLSAVLFCNELGLDSLIFEGDSSQVVHAVKNFAFSAGKLQCTILDIIELLCGA